MMLEILAGARLEPRARLVDWQCLLLGAFGACADAVGQLYDEASTVVNVLPFPGRRSTLTTPRPRVGFARLSAAQPSR